MNESSKVFISYSWKDKPLVRALEVNLRAAGIEVWVDNRGIRAGDNLPDEISNALRWCDTLLLIWSNASVDSYWVKLEWTNALSLKKKIIPCLVDRTELPSILSHKAYVEMSDLKSGTNQLLSALQCSNQPKDGTPSFGPDSNDAQRAKRWLRHWATNPRARILISTFGILIVIVALGTRWIIHKQERTRSTFQEESARTQAPGLVQVNQPSIQEESARPNQSPDSVRRSQPFEVDFTLSPGAIRNDAEQASIPSLRGVQTLRLHLLLFANKYQSYQAKLRTEDGRVLVAVADLRANIQDGHEAVIMRLPAQSLNAGHYIIELSATAGGETQELASYFFRVVNK